MQDSTQYRAMNHPITFICSRHGEFKTRPANMKAAKYGCTGCGYESKQLSVDELKKRLSETYGDTITFPADLSAAYGGKRSKVTVTCNQCKKELTRTWESFLKGSGCLNCYFQSKKIPYDDFLSRAVDQHGQKYKYYSASESSYDGVQSPVRIHCTNCQTDFTQQAYSHLIGHGCPKCNTGCGAGFDNESLFAEDHELANSLCFLYYIKIEGMYKIGITKGTMKQRFGGRQIQEIYIRQTSRKYAWRAEQKILQYFQNYKEINPTLQDGGSTECFNTDISQDSHFIELFNTDFDI